MRASFTVGQSPSGIRNRPRQSIAHNLGAVFTLACKGFLVAYSCRRVSFSRIVPVARLPGMRSTPPRAFAATDVRQYPVRVAVPPTQAMCTICNSAGPVVKAGPVWSRRKDEPTPWIVDVACATCCVQCGRTDT